MYELIRYEVRESIATIAFNRPDKLNAYTPEMGEEVVAAFERARDDEQARVVILTGEGRAFCAGIDLDYFKAHMAGKNPGKGPKLGEEAFVRSWPLELVEYPKPVIAAINGNAYGVGVTMTLGCDVRIAARSAVLGLNFAKLGVLPGLGSTHHLPRLVGLGKANELVLSAAKLSAQQAHEVGLVERVVDDDALIGEARALAAAMAEVRPEVLAAAKKALRHGAEAPLADAIREEQRLSAELGRLRE
ncbi:MAG: enoyl-CoA hydratase/isomerase family protein, partial [Deltaproteobacteria bacterium]|nr:enoyl-CoA hydratase/isomerase family protein [Deltaproteobacteria bacterium]